MDGLDQLIPTGIFNRGVEEMSEEFEGFPYLTTFIFVLIIVSMIFMAVSVDSFVIRSARGMA
jgi:hypothetical protein